MNIRDLKYFIAVAKYRHFGQAAKACFVSQPALSMQLKKLEEELNIQLFERSNKNVIITLAGEKLLEQAKIIIKASEDMENIAKTYQNPFSGEIHIGAFPTLAPYFLPIIVPVIVHDLPKLKLFLTEDKTLELIDQLKTGKIDLALLALPILQNEDEFITKQLFTEPFYLAVSKNHPLAKRTTVQAPDIKNEDLLLLEEGHCLRSQALQICSLLGASEHRDFRATSLETLRQMVAANAGITLIPKLAIREDTNIVYIPFADSSLQRCIGMVYRKTDHRIELMEKLYICLQPKTILTS